MCVCVCRSVYLVRLFPQNIYLIKTQHEIGKEELLLFLKFIEITFETSEPYKWSQSQNQSYTTTDEQLPSLCWRQAPIWERRPVFLFLSLIIFRQLRIC
jgi:hypothetical protein